MIFRAGQISQKYSRTTPAAASAGLLSISGIALASLSLVLAVGCDPLTIMETADPESLEVYYSGCQTVFEGPICELPELDEQKRQSLTIWLAGQSIPTVGFESDDTVVELEPQFTSTGDGLRMVVSLPQTAGQLHITVDSSPSQGWSLEISPSQKRHARLVQAKQLRKDKKHAEVKKLLETELSQFTVRDRGEALSLLGRSELNLKNPTAAVKRLEEAYHVHLQAGNLSAILRDTTTYSFTSVYRLGMQFDKASEHVGKMRGYLPQHYESQHFYQWSRGLIAEKSSDHRQALFYSKQAMDLALRMGNQSNADYLAHIHSRALMNLHKFGAAAKVLEESVSRNQANKVTCELAEYLNSLGWAQLLHRLDLQSDSDTMGIETDHLPDPTQHFEMALEISRNKEICLYNNKEDTNSLLNLALSHLAKSELDKAESYLEKAISNGPATLYYQMWFEQTQADLAIAREQPRLALKHFKQLRNLSKNSSHAYLYWRSLVGEASAQTSIGQHALAQKLWAKAQLQVEQESLQAPIHSGRESFLAHRQKATQAYVQSLLQNEKIEEALQIVQQTRSQLLRNLQWNSRTASLDDAKKARWQTAMALYKQNRRSLQQLKQSLWELPQNELAQAEQTIQSLESKVDNNLDSTFALLELSRKSSRHSTNIQTPNSGEAVITYFKLKTSWIAFLHTNDALHYKTLQRLPELDNANELGRVLLEPFGNILTDLEKLFIQPWGSLRQIDFHRLPLRGKPLITYTQIAYSLGVRDSNGQAPREWSSALVVSDPSGNLPLARQEALAVARILEENSSIRVELIKSSDADAKTVEQLLQESEIFHYAGHGQFDKNAFSDSALLLANNSTMNVGDILALPKAPRHVVLSACESAKTDIAFPLEGLGLAQAFALAGSESVIATTRPIEDELSKFITTKLYKSFQTSGDFAAALQDAQIMASVQYPDADWSTFRLITPN
jgi:cellulose synthase operon protein C